MTRIKALLAATLLAGLGAAGVVWAPDAPQAAVATGARAPTFSLVNADGRSVSLEAFAGKVVVLEWHNPGCPFVQKHYSSGNMQRTQQAAIDQGVIWLTINSGAEGKQGFLTSAEAKAMIARDGSHASHYLFDRAGIVGRSFDARTTPHMFIIDARGRLAYQGGIDDKPTANAADIPRARNHVLAALDEIEAGKPVSVASSRAYGCSVKYRDS